MTDRPLDPAARALARLTTASADYPAIKHEAEARIARWEWATAPRYSDEPAFFEVEKIRRGVVLAGRPRAVAGRYQYGLDAADRVVVERLWTELPGVFGEIFFEHTEEGSARLCFEAGGKGRCLHVAWLARDTERVIRSVHVAYARGGGSATTYTYDERGRVLSLERHHEHDFGSSHDRREIVYDEHDEIVRVLWHTDAGQTLLHFERPAEADRLAAAEARLVGGLADAIVAAIAGLSDRSPLFAIAVITSGGDDQHRFPPVIALGRAAVADALLREHGAEAPAFVWNPAEWPEAELALALDPTLAALCASVSQDIWQNDRDAQADHALLRLATAIDERVLPCPRADGFAVVVVAIDGEDAITRQVAAQLDRPTRELLRTRGLLEAG